MSSVNVLAAVGHNKFINRKVIYFYWDNVEHPIMILWNDNINNVNKFDIYIFF